MRSLVFRLPSYFLCAQERIPPRLSDGRHQKAAERKRMFCMMGIILEESGERRHERRAAPALIRVKRLLSQKCSGRSRRDSLSGTAVTFGTMRSSAYSQSIGAVLCFHPCSSLEQHDRIRYSRHRIQRKWPPQSFSSRTSSAAMKPPGARAKRPSRLHPPPQEEEEEHMRLADARSGGFRRLKT